nr:hypothetical protein BaRGS_002959 [Batillaria attramentaria]
MDARAPGKIRSGSGLFTVPHNRLSTFPPGRRNDIVHILSTLGFVYTRDGVVRCAFCGVNYGDWTDLSLHVIHDTGSYGKLFSSPGPCYPTLKTTVPACYPTLKTTVPACYPTLKTTVPERQTN